MARHYSHAPIIEVTIDMKVSRPDTVSMDVLKSLADSLSDQFPLARELTNCAVVCHSEEGSKSEVSEQDEKVGLRLEDLGGGRVLQVQRTGFTYSHLPPHSQWKAFRDEAKLLWRRFVEATRTPRISRLAVRAINKLHLPATMSELGRYSNLSPQVPEVVAAAPMVFFSQLQLNGEQWAKGARVLVNTGAAPLSDRKVELLLDFDVYVEALQESDSAEIWETLDRLNTARDELFEACITDATRELLA